MKNLATKIVSHGMTTNCIIVIGGAPTWLLFVAIATLGGVFRFPPFKGGRKPEIRPFSGKFPVAGKKRKIGKEGFLMRIEGDKWSGPP